MKKYIYGILLLLGGILLNNNILKGVSQTNVMSELLLANIEALSHDENLPGSESKTEETSQYGPFLNDEGRLFYWICTQTDCYGKGYIDCNVGFNCDGTVDAI